MHEQAENDERSNLAGDAVWSVEAKGLWKELESVLVSIWSAYLQNGPGSVDPNWGERLDIANRHLEELISDGVLIKDKALVENRLRFRLTQLAQQCVRDSEGLSFVTGEAGLIPRKELHDEFDSGLRELSAFTKNLDVN